MTPRAITIQTAAPRGSFAGAVAQAFYTVENNQVILTDRDGNRLHDHEGKDYAQTLAEGDSAHQIAGLLLKRLRITVRGDRISGFDRPVVYPRGKFWA